MLRRAYKSLGHSKPLIAPSGIIRGGEAYLRIGMGQRFSDLHGLTLQRFVLIRPSLTTSWVRVQKWQHGKPYPLDLIDRGVKSGQQLPFKTTRHRFDQRLPDVEVLREARQPG